MPMDVATLKTVKAQVDAAQGITLEGLAGKYLGILKPERASRQVRRFLAEAYGFLRGTQSIGEFGSYGLEQAIAARIGEIEGTPRNPSKPNRLQRIDRLLEATALVVAAAQKLTEEDLGVDVIAGLGTSHVSADGFSGNLGKALSTVDKIQSGVNKVKSAPGELTDQIDTSKGKVMTGAQTKIQTAQDALENKVTT